MSCILFRTAVRHTVGEYFDLQTMKLLHKHSQLNLTWPPHRELLERCDMLTDGYFAVQDGGTLTASDAAVRVLGLTAPSRALVQYAQTRVFCVRRAITKFPNKKFHKISVRLHNSLQPHQKSQPLKILQLSSKAENNKLISWNVKGVEICTHIAIIVP